MQLLALALFFFFLLGVGGEERYSEIETAVQRRWKLNCGTNC